MPNLNARGPEGLGPVTGRGMGQCGGAKGQNLRTGKGYGRGVGAEDGRGRGRGMCLGMGLGMRHGSGGGAGVGLGMGYGRGRRAELLRAELERTESILGGAGSQPESANSEEESR